MVTKVCILCNREGEILAAHADPYTEVNIEFLEHERDRIGQSLTVRARKIQPDNPVQIINPDAP